MQHICSKSMLRSEWILCMNFRLATFGVSSNYGKVSQQQKCGKAWWFAKPPWTPPPRFGVFTNKKMTPNFLFWEWAIDARNKFYTWSHQKIFRFDSVILVHFCPKSDIDGAQIKKKKFKKIKKIFPKKISK